MYMQVLLEHIHLIFICISSNALKYIIHGKKTEILYIFDFGYFPYLLMVLRPGTMKCLLLDPFSYGFNWSIQFFKIFWFFSIFLIFSIILTFWIDSSINLYVFYLYFNIFYHNWSWLIMTDHDWPRLIITDHDWSWLLIINDE